MDLACCVCGKQSLNVYREENNPHDAILCGVQCQLKYHNIEAVPPNPVALNNEFKKWPVYLNSAKILTNLKKNDIFAYLSISNYGQSPAVNRILFEVKGDWTLFKQAIDTNNIPDIWDTFFKSMIRLAPSFGFPFTDKSGKIILRHRSDVLNYYPELKPYVEIQDKILFVRLYISAIQSIILSTPAHPFSIMAWRGYSPLAIPNSLAMNILNYRPGEQITNWGLTSISLDHRVSSSFANVKEACCMMYVQIPAGFPTFMLTSDGGDFSFPHIPTPYSQMEILLPAGTIFRIGNRMGPRVYTPYNQPGVQASLETIEVYVVGIAANKGYITPKERFSIVSRAIKSTKKKSLRTIGNKKILYHQTSPQAAEAIIASQVFFPGKSGVLGGGIYFAASVVDTDRKAETKGVVLEAEVNLGNIKSFIGPNKNLTLADLSRDGFNSAYIMMNSGPEYVVYDTKQVTNIRYASGQDIMNRELTLTYAGLEAAKILILIIGKHQGQQVAFIGRDEQTKQYRLFGGTHGKKRSRGDNARHEWCEEFGVFLKDQGIVCDPPTFDELKNMPKIFENGRLERGGPPRTNIVILANVGSLNITESEWNRNNQKLRAKKGTPKEYKEIDKLHIIKLKDLIMIANSTKPGMVASKGDLVLSYQLLHAVNEFKKAGYL